ncbi:MAG: hypothetical protein ACP5HJ_02810 [Candidatus Micrarchaeia archaeon]
MKRFLTRAEMFELKIRKCLGRGNGLTEEEKNKIKRQAILIAAFCSSISWDNYRALKEHKPIKIKCEKRILEEDWKRITSSDVVEVANLSIPDSIVKKWIFENVEKDEIPHFLEAWDEFKENFGNGKAYIIERRRGEKAEAI